LCLLNLTPLPKKNHRHPREGKNTNLSFPFHLGVEASFPDKRQFQCTTTLLALPEPSGTKNVKNIDYNSAYSSLFQAITKPEPQEPQVPLHFASVSPLMSSQQQPVVLVAVMAPWVQAQQQSYP
jgi:hypothetical protein